MSNLSLFVPCPPGGMKGEKTMPVYKDESNNGTWYVKCMYTDYTGTKRQKKKRGFALLRDAKEWERDFLATQSAQPSMPFKNLVALYLEDKKQHNKLITYQTKENRIRKWISPYFEQKPVNAITAADVRQWQTTLKNSLNANKQPLSPGYMQNLVVELSSIFNFAVQFYGLTVNPCRIAGNSVGKKQKSMNFWTKEEFDRFISTFEKSDPLYTAFLVLYYCGLRIGELEALTAADVDTAGNTLTINKTYHLINGEGVITSPKTEKANRTITLPPFLSARIQAHERRIYGIDADTRLFTASHTTYARILKEHAQKACLKQIRLHDLRHSHASLLIEMGFSALLVSERLGHENVSTTLNIYSHLFPSKQAEVAEKLAQLCSDNAY